MKEDALVEHSAWQGSVPALRVFYVIISIFLCSFSGKVGVRGKCVADGEASKAGVVDEDLEDVFHNCTRFVWLTSPFFFLQARGLPGEGLQHGVQQGERAVRVQGGHSVERQVGDKL